MLSNRQFFLLITFAANKGSGNELTGGQRHATKATPLVQLFPKKKKKFLTVYTHYLFSASHNREKLQKRKCLIMWISIP